MFSVGIVGLPNAGKSTLFSALTKQAVAIASFPFTTIEPNIGRIAVPDERLTALTQLLKPERSIAATIEFVDIAGLVRGAHKGEGLGNQFLAHIREVDLIVEVVRAFEDSTVSHPEEQIDPKRDRDIIALELLLKDQETAEAQKEKWRGAARSGEKSAKEQLACWEKIAFAINAGKPAREVELNEQGRVLLEQIPLLTAKPIIPVFNILSHTTGKHPDSQARLPSGGQGFLEFDLKLEAEIAELSEEERRELDVRPRIDELISTCYNALDLVTFFTIAGGKEIRSWIVQRGTEAREAAGAVHSDFRDRFIRAEVIPIIQLLETGSWSNARETGRVRTEGRDYVVHDGDIIEFKI